MRYVQTAAVRSQAALIVSPRLRATNANAPAPTAATAAHTSAETSFDMSSLTWVGTRQIARRAQWREEVAPRSRRLPLAHSFPPPSLDADPRALRAPRPTADPRRMRA